MSLLGVASNLRFSTQLKLGVGGGFYLRNYLFGETKEEFAAWLTDSLMYVSGGSATIALCIVLGVLVAMFASGFKQLGGLLVGPEVKA